MKRANSFNEEKMVISTAEKADVPFFLIVEEAPSVYAEALSEQETDYKDWIVTGYILAWKADFNGRKTTMWKASEKHHIIFLNNATMIQQQ